MWENMCDSKDSDKIQVVDVNVKCRTMQQRVKVKAVIDVVERGRVKVKENLKEVKLWETGVMTVEMMILKSKSPQRLVVTSLRMI